MEKFQIEQATERDINFLVTTIIEAEKSGTTTIGLAEIFNLSESTLRQYLVQMFEEGIDGCEFSMNSFWIARENQQYAGAFAGWIEGENEDNQSSSWLKSALISYVFPASVIQSASQHNELVKSLSFERLPHTHQLEYAYVHPHYRGQGVLNLIVQHMLKNVQKQNPQILKSQVQVFAQNKAALRSYQKMGYQILAQKKSFSPDALNYFPFNEKYLMEKDLQ